MIETANWAPEVIKDLANGCLGKFLGQGVARHVWVSTIDPTKVIKLEIESFFQNIREWDTWLELKDSKYAKYLAPCIGISDGGRMLVQERIEPLRKDMEKCKMPDFLTDFKRSNYGIYNGRVVCCDYGTNILLSFALSERKIKLITPNWWD